MFKRIYYKIDIELLSPLSVGSGENAQTDKDIIVDALGNPFIPATAITGVLRSYVTEQGKTVKDGIPLDHAIFGYTLSKKLSNDECKKPENIETSTLAKVYDAYCTSDTKCCITTRDCVKLKNKVAVENAKFDMEAVETGAKFTGYIELLSDEDWCVSAIEEALSALHIGRIFIGSKTSRGYGRVSLSVRKLVISDVAEWLGFRMFESDSWQTDKAEALDLSRIAEKFEFVVQLKLRGGISVRKYTTTVSKDGSTAPDYQSLALESITENGEPVAVIPGTSWAGAFRDRFAELTDAATVQDLFGDIETKTNVAYKSKIVFSESVFSDGVYKISTRNSIDRFSGATKSGALYTEKTYYYGTTQLSVSFAENPDDNVLWALGACFADLHHGFLSVGGLTSVGRGLFEISSVKFNDKELQLDNIINGEIDEWVREVTGV